VRDVVENSSDKKTADNTLKSKSWMRSNKLLKPFEFVGKSSEEDGQKSLLLARLTILSALAMMVDMTEKDLMQAAVVKDVESYMPYTVWKHYNKTIEMIFG